jgi:hypothetical protein
LRKTSANAEKNTPVTIKAVTINKKTAVRTLPASTPAYAAARETEAVCGSIENKDKTTVSPPYRPGADISAQRKHAHKMTAAIPNAVITEALTSESLLLIKYLLFHYFADYDNIRLSHIFAFGENVRPGNAALFNAALP